MTKLAFILTALFFLSVGAQAHSPLETLSSYFLPHSQPQELAAVAKFFDLEHRAGQGFEVQVPQGQASLLLALAPSATLLERDVAASIEQQLQSYQLLSGENRYHTFDEVRAWMQDHAAQHPDLASVVEYGKSGNGLPLSAIRIASAHSAGKPVVMVTAATHGDELITTEVAMFLVDRLLNAYGKEDRITKIVDSHDIYIVPVLNADGFTQRRRYDGNADPNRSYPYPQKLDNEPTPSITGIINLFNMVNPQASLDFHAYGEMTMYPWAYTYNSIESEPRERMDKLTKFMSEQNRYSYGPISQVIYIAPGSSADYYFWKKGTTAIAIEMGNSKVPSPSRFPEYFESQEESFWRFLEGI